MDGFSVEGLLSQAAQGKLAPVDPVVVDTAQSVAQTGFNVESLLKQALQGKLAEKSQPSVSGGLPDWAIYDTPGQKIQNEVRGSPVLTQGPPPQTFGNVASSIPSGLYEGLAKAGNLPTHAVNVASRLFHGIGGPDLGQLGAPFEENPTAYHPGGALSESLHSGASAASNTAALGAAGRILSPMLPAGSVPQIATEAVGRTPPSIIAAAGVGGAAEEPAARQVSEPFKPLVRMGANIGAGGVTAGMGAAAGNAVRGAIEPGTAHLAQMARDVYGIPIRAGQISENRIVRTADSVLKSVPLSGHTHVDDEAIDAWIRAATNTMGENSTRLTPEVMNAARTRIGNGLDDIGARTNLRLDNDALNRLTDIHDRAGLPESGLDPTQTAQVRAHIDKILDVAAQNNGIVPGDVYQNITRQGESLGLLQNQNSTVAGHLATDIRRTLDGMLDRSVAPEDAASLRELRGQWKAMRTLEPLTLRADTPGKGAPSIGFIDPAQLRHVVNQSYGRAAFAEPGVIPLNDLANIGQRFLKEVGTSQTSERSLVQKMIHGGGAAVAGLFGAEHGLGISPSEVILPAAAAAGGTMAISRGLSSALRSDRLANRMIQRGIVGAPPPQSAIGSAGQASVPLMTSSGVRQLESPPDIPQPSVNTRTGLPQFNMKDAQDDAKSGLADSITQKMASGELGDDASLKTWISENKRELRSVFGGQGIQNIVQVSSMMRRVNGDKSEPNTLFSVFLRSAKGPELQSAIREAKINGVDDLVALAILSPALTKVLATRTDRGDMTRPGQLRLADAIREASGVNADVDDNRGGFPPGARVGRGRNMGQDSQHT